VWMGFLQAGWILLSAGVLEVAQRRLDMAKVAVLARVQIALAAVLVVCLFTFGAASSFPLAAGLYIIIMTLRQVSGPLYTTWVNHRLNPQVRATLLSASSQVDAIGQIAGGPLVGLVARQVSLQAGLFASAGLLSPVLLIFGWQIQKPEEEP
jgi:DHA3 family tetracycline resistance protein-like MFS transporter